jgi:predicted RNA methylase
MKVSNEVLNVLAAAKMTDESLVLVGQLDRKLYAATNAVLEAAGGKWNKKTKSHVFPVDAADAMEQIIQTGEVTLIRTIQQDFGCFYSPYPVVARLMALADVRSGMRVLEPSAGLGAIAYPCAASGALVDCYEIQQGNAAMLAMTAPHDLGSTKVADFLQIEPRAEYDRVVMNPPFAKQADIKHVTHALKFLKPGGLLVSVMSASVAFRDNKLTQDFRDLIRVRGGDIEALDDGAFKESGTMVRTVIVTIPAAISE